MLLAIGTYIGNGVDDRSITGIGFQPDLVLVKGNTSTVGDSDAKWRSNSMVGDLSGSWGTVAGGGANVIQSLEIDGFQIGTSIGVNEDTKTYYYFAFRDNGDGDFATGTYEGNATDNRAITVGFQPTLVVVRNDSVERAVYKTDQHTGENTTYFMSNVADIATNAIQSLNVNGFTVGTRTTVNDNLDTHDWFAFKDVTNEFNVVKYTGNGANDRSITGVGFQPEVAATKESSTSSGVFRTTSHVGDSSIIVSAAGVNAVDCIQAFEADGMQVGTNGAVNGNLINYYALFWKVPASGGAVAQVHSNLLLMGTG